MRIGLDFDEPLYPWFDCASAACVRAGLPVPPNPWPRTWEDEPEWHVSRADWAKVLDRELDDPHGMFAQPLRPGVVELNQRMRDAGHSVHIITARGGIGNAEKIRAATLASVTAAGLTYDTLHFSNDKGGVASELGLDVFLDDRPKHVAEVSAAGTDAYLLDTRWTRSVEVVPGHRVGSLLEFYERVA